MVSQISVNPINTAQIGIVTSGEMKKMAEEKQVKQQPASADTVQISQPEKEELPITEREMKLLNSIKRHEFLQAFTSSKGVGVSNKLTTGIGVGSIVSLITATIAANMSSLPVVSIGAAVISFGLVYAGSSAVQGARNALKAEKEWGSTFINSSEKDSLKKVMEEYPQIGYRHDAAQTANGKKEEAALTEREMKLLGKIKQKEFMHAFVSTKGMDPESKQVLIGFGSMFSAMLGWSGASLLGASPVLTIAAAAAVPVAFYLGASAFQGLGNAREAEKEWGKRFIDSSEKDSVKKVMDEFPSLGYRFQV
jgi:hypothetical protein